MKRGGSRRGGEAEIEREGMGLGRGQEGGPMREGRS